MRFLQKKKLFDKQNRNIDSKKERKIMKKKN